MTNLLQLGARSGADATLVNRTVEIETQERVQFVDITHRVEAIVADSRVASGIVSVQTLHTTTGIVVNENEALLLEDFHDLLARLAPGYVAYRHNKLDIRNGPLPPDERLNGDAHARALLMRTSETMAVVDGELLLGRWQKIFFAEFDGAQSRRIVVSVLGVEPVRTSATIVNGDTEFRMEPS